MFLPRPVDRRSLLVALALLTFAFPRHVRADDLRLHVDQHWVQIVTPKKDWVDANLDGNWYTGNTPDETVWFSATMFDWLTEQRLKTWLPRFLDTFLVDVLIDWGTFHSAKGRIRDWNVIDYFAAGTREGAPCEIAVTVYELDEKARLVVTTGGSAADRQKHRQTIEGILATIKRSQAHTGTPSNAR